MAGDNHDSTLGRRTFLKASGIAAGAAALGVGLSGSAAAEPGFDPSFANPRVREAQKVWAKGYRGRPDRTVGYTDTGSDVRHPDLYSLDDDGDYAGVTVYPKDGDIKLTRPSFVDDYLSSENRKQVATGGPVTGTARPGAYVVPADQGSEQVAHQFTIPAEKDYDVITATLSWSPYDVQGLPNTDNTNDLELRIDRQTEDGWEAVSTAATAGMPEVIENAPVTPGETYRFVIEQYIHTVSNYEITWEFFRYEDDLRTVSSDEVFDFVTDDGTGIDAGDAPKVVGWMDAGFGSTGYAPFDENGHGTHVSSIMAGSGRASEVDADRSQVEKPRTVLTAGDFLEYEVEAAASTAVFAAVEATGVEVFIVGPDGRELDYSGGPLSDRSTVDLNLVDHPTVQEYHENGGEATYRVVVRPLEGEAASTARVERVAVGAFEDVTSETTGDRVEGDVSMHSGVAPDMSILGMQGLSGPLGPLSSAGDQFTEFFNLRGVNMSWGPVLDPLGLTTPPSGAAGGNISGRVAVIKEMANHGILSCISAGNSFTPGQTGAPATADESINVAATGPRDGLTSYSSGGTAAQDDDSDRSYIKPDVAAPGGYLTDAVRAAKAQAEDGPTAGADSVRDYVNIAGTSMSAPFTTGTVGLIAEAMEFTPDGEPRREQGAPESITLPAPASTGYGDAMRLKSVLLATATTTAFTAAPYHRAHAPTYEGPTGKDIYEGYGRINPDAAVDAVTRDLLPADARTDGEPADPADAPANAAYENVVSGAVGLNVPDDSRALAGFLDLSGGSAEVSVDVSHLSGGNKGMVKGDPHVDLVVYDPAAAGDTSDGTAAVDGDPVAVASAQGTQGSASVSLSVPDEGKTYMVVAKLVNVPGVVNGYDVQAHLDLSVSFSAAALPTYTVDGTVTDDGSVFTGGQTNEVTVDVTNTESEGMVWVGYRIPESWEIKGGSSHSRDGPLVRFDTRVPAGKSHTFTLFVEAPSGAGETGQYEFGPAEYLPEASDYLNSGEWTVISGTSSTETVVGVDQTAPTGSATDTDGATDTGTGADDATDSATNTTDTASDAL